MFEEQTQDEMTRESVDGGRRVEDAFGSRIRYWGTIAISVAAICAILVYMAGTQFQTIDKADACTRETKKEIESVKDNVAIVQRDMATYNADMVWVKGALMEIKIAVRDKRGHDE